MSTTETLFGVQETEKVNPEPEKTVEKEPEQTVEVTEKEPEPAAEEQEKTYTPEELASAIANDEDIDTSRLSLEGQALMKSFQRGLTPKLQAIADLKKQLESEVKQKEAPKPVTIEDYFNLDPEGTLVWIDQQITVKKQEAKKLRGDGDRDASDEARDVADDWQTTKGTLLARRMLLNEKDTKNERKIRTALESYPDYSSKKDMIIQFLMKESDLSEEEAKDVVDASKGLSNIKLAKLIAKFAEKSVLQETAKSKIVKKTPEELGRAGSSQPTKSKETFDYQKEFEQAKKTGNWAKVLQYKGAV